MMNLCQKIQNVKKLRTIIKAMKIKESKKIKSKVKYLKIRNKNF